MEIESLLKEKEEGIQEEVTKQYIRQEGEGNLPEKVVVIQSEEEDNLPEEDQ